MKKRFFNNVYIYKERSFTNKKKLMNIYIKKDHFQTKKN